MADRKSAHSSAPAGGPRTDGAAGGHGRPGATSKKVGARPDGDGALISAVISY